MRSYQLCTPLALVLICFAFAQHGGRQDKNQQSTKSEPGSAQPELKDALESRVKAEWDAYKNKDKKAFSDLVADDFVGVESDGQGTRTKAQAMIEVERSNVSNYALFAFKVIPIASDAAFVTYENTIEFPRWAKVRYLRLYVSELWMKRKGQWEMRHSQETQVR